MENQKKLSIASLGKPHLNSDVSEDSLQNTWQMVIIIITRHIDALRMSFKQGCVQNKLSKTLEMCRHHLLNYSSINTQYQLFIPLINGAVRSLIYQLLNSTPSL